MLVVRCARCGRVLYSGERLVRPREVARMHEGRCPRCGRELAGRALGVEVERRAVEVKFTPSERMVRELAEDVPRDRCTWCGSDKWKLKELSIPAVRRGGEVAVYIVVRVCPLCAYRLIDELRAWLDELKRGIYPR